MAVLADGFRDTPHLGSIGESVGRQQPTSIHEGLFVGLPVFLAQRSPQSFAICRCRNSKGVWLFLLNASLAPGVARRTPQSNLGLVVVSLMIFSP